MTNLFYLQYELVKSSRQVVFEFLQEVVKSDILKPISTFNEKTISFMYLHIANTYIAWTGNFALKESDSYYDQEMTIDLMELRNIFDGIDKMMSHFIDHFSTNHDTSISGYKWPEKYIETNVYGVFTHVLSHEFHHKGQAMTMARLLGHIPPDTDVMRF